MRMLVEPALRRVTETMHNGKTSVHYGCADLNRRRPQENKLECILPAVSSAEPRDWDGDCPCDMRHSAERDGLDGTAQESAMRTIAFE